MSQNVYRVPVLAKLPETDQIQWFNKKEFLQEEGKSLFFDGVGVIKEELYSYHQLGDMKKLDVLQLKPFDIKGALTVYYDDGDKSRIISDFVGSSFIYFYKKNGYELYSSCLISLKEVLMDLGINLKKSLFFQVCENIFGNGCFGYSSYQDVYTLPVNSMVIASKNNIKVLEWSISAWLLEKNISYEECLNLAKNDVLANIKAVLNSKYKYRLAHITGGMDSRIVVSAIDNLNVIEDFELCCLGKPGDLDYDNAYQISGVLGAKFSNRENYIVKNYPTSIEEKYQWEFEVTEGMITNQSFHRGTTTNPDLIILSGGYGGLLRTFYSYDDYKKTWNAAEELPIFEKIYTAQGKSSSLLNDTLVAKVADKVSLFVDEAKLIGLTKLQTSELFFMINRNRYYIGNITKTASKFTSRLDPLYSPYVFKLAFLLERESQREERVPLFDLMHSLSPTLSLLPFGTTKWSDELLLQKGIKVTSFVENQHPEVVDLPKQSAEVTHGWMPPIAKSTRIKAKEMKASIWQVEIYPILQKKCLEFLKKSDNTIFEYYDKKEIDRLLNQEHKNRVDIRKVINLYSTILWLSE